MTERPGFSLIEMVVALGVFSLAALALLNLMGEGVRSAVRAETRLSSVALSSSSAACAALTASISASLGQALGGKRAPSKSGSGS